MNDATANSTSPITHANPSYQTLAFHGNGKEYFSFWIVNLLLTIVTLGIYSAWAKVRTNRYFYSNTELDGHRFSYLAQPLQVLKGRLIALVMFGSYFAASYISPAIALVIILLIFVLTPLIVVQSLRFRLKMTAYRNVRFGFKGQYGEAFKVFLLLPILAVCTLYITSPWVLRRIDAFMLGNITYGDKEFNAPIEGQVYWLNCFYVLCISAVVVILAYVGLDVLGIQVAVPEGQETASTADKLALILLPSYLAIYLIAGSFYSAKIREYLFATVRVDDLADFNSTVTFSSLLGLRVTNLLLLVVTLGLAFPWVKVRKARFMTEHTECALADNINTIVAGKNADGSVVGDEASSLFDVDVALS